MYSGGVLEQFSFDGVAVEFGHDAQAAGDGGACAAAGHVTAKAFDVRAAGLEKVQRRLAVSPHSGQLVLEGGMLLAAYGGRRPTRDAEIQAQPFRVKVTRC
jgi:hypothetical protein